MPILWTISGALILLISVAHVFLGLVKVVPEIKQAPDAFIRLYKGFFVISGLYWAAGGLALLWFANAPDGPLRTATLWITLFMYGLGAAANAWSTRMRDPGWAMLFVVCVLLYFGA